MTEIALAFLVFFGFAPVANANIIDDAISLPSRIADGAQIAVREVFPRLFDQASLASVFSDIKCFFGIDCQKPPASAPVKDLMSNDQFSKNIQESNINQEPVENTDAVGQGLTSIATEDRPSNPNPPTQIVQNINPTREVQTIRTINTNTNTVVVDTVTKNKVDQLLRQMNSDRPNYSTGQSVSLPANLVSKTLTITSGAFNVDDNGNATANNIAANGNLTVQGNFTVAGAQTYSGAAVFNATTTIASALAITSGSPGAGKVLTSDANGLARWQTPVVDGGTWGSVAGTLSSQTDLQAALDAKQNSLTSTQISNWDAAYGWGDHSAEGYLTSFTEADPIVKAIDGIVKSNGATIGAAVAGTDYLTPSGSAALLTNFPTLNQSTTGNAATVTNGVYTNAANSFTLINPLTTIAESWIGPSSTNGIYFKSGNVGIGTTSPGSKLDVSGDIRIHSGSGGQIIFADGSTMSSAGLGSAAALSNTADAIVTGDSDASGGGDVILKTGSNDRLHILNSGNIGIGVASPAAILHLKAGTTAANSAPLKFTSGDLLSAPEAGAVEFLSDAFYGTITTGAARKQFAFIDSSITGNAATATNLTGLTATIANLNSVTGS
ncbi:MAG: hypothetical protein WCX69_04070, partial [Candidatus Paceibacterota bacterium]